MEVGKISNYFVHDSAFVEDADIGKDTNVWHFAHVREGSNIGKGCNIGKDVYIDTGVEIGDNVKIQNGVSVYEGVKVEDDVFLGPHMTFTNDLYPRAFNDEWEVVPTTVKKGASIGAHATINPGITIGKYSMVGSGSVVIEDVPKFGLVYGNPAKLRGFVCYCGQRLREDDVVDRDDGVVRFKCSSCDEEVEVREEDYDRLAEKD